MICQAPNYEEPEEDPRHLGKFGKVQFLPHNGNGPDLLPLAPGCSEWKNSRKNHHELLLHGNYEWLKSRQAHGEQPEVVVMVRALLEASPTGH